MPNGNPRDCASHGSGGGPGNGQGGGFGGGHATRGDKPACGGCDAGCGRGATLAGITGNVPFAPSLIGDEDFARVFFGGMLDTLEGMYKLPVVQFLMPIYLFNSSKSYLSI